MVKRTGFQVDQHKTLEQVVIEHQVDVEILRFCADALLTSNEGEALAQLQQEPLQLVDERLFQVGFLFGKSIRWRFTMLYTTPPSTDFLLGFQHCS